MNWKLLAALVGILLGLGLLVGSRHRSGSAVEPVVTPTASVLLATPSKISVGVVPPIPFKLDNGWTIHEFATNLGTARDLQFSPGGTLLVSNPTDSRVIALPDKNHDGVADQNKVVINNGKRAHGLAFYNGKLYVAEVDRVVRYNWDENNLAATFDQELFKLPANNDHNNRTIIFDGAGKMYVSVGSTCNVCNETDPHSATVLTADSDGHNLQILASGMRNAPFMAVNPTTGAVWVTEMGRDNLGDDIPPDEINILQNGNYGWPKCYGNKTHDTNFDKSSSDPCGSTIGPIFEIPAHSAPLGLAFEKDGNLLVAYHGSWNRSIPDGYKVVNLKVSGNQITDSVDFLTGFIINHQVLGRPVDLTFDGSGNLYLSDDKAGKVYIIQKGS